MDDIRGALNTFQDRHVCHVKREANAVGHGLVKVVVKEVIDQVWIEHKFLIEFVLLYY